MKYVIVWVVLVNDVMLENLCLYCVLRLYDLGYYDGDDDDANAKDFLSVVLDLKKVF